MYAARASVVDIRRRPSMRATILWNVHKRHFMEAYGEVWRYGPACGGTTNEIEILSCGYE
jgi:hypothetical protein